MISRNIDIAKQVTCIIYVLCSKNSRFLDVGGGYGILTRVMRDIVFDFYCYDKYCNNIFAQGFDLSNTTPPFDAITCFEVLEHVEYPVSFISDLLSFAVTRTAIFSTLLFEGLPPNPKEWWYYSFGCGQHISFFQLNTLKYIGNQLGLNLYSNNTIHVLTDKKCSDTIFKLITSRWSTILARYIRQNMKSRTFSDYEVLSKSLSSGIENPAIKE